VNISMRQALSEFGAPSVLSTEEKPPLRKLVRFKILFISISKLFNL
jgi:hypothetical protein